MSSNVSENPKVTRKLAKDKTASITVVEAVATASNCSPLELPPLHDTIETDALNRLCKSDDVEVQFRYNGHTVIVNCTNEVSVLPMGEHNS